MKARFVHLKRPNSELVGCGEVAGKLVATFDINLVTCKRCIKRRSTRHKFENIEPLKRTDGRVVQPGGGHRR